MEFLSKTSFNRPFLKDFRSHQKTEFSRFYFSIILLHYTIISYSTIALLFYYGFTVTQQLRWVSHFINELMYKKKSQKFSIWIINSNYAFSLETIHTLNFFFSIIITMYIDSLVTNILKIKANKTRQHRTQNLQKTYTACCKFCT